MSAYIDRIRLWLDVVLSLKGINPRFLYIKHYIKDCEYPYHDREKSFIHLTILFASACYSLKLLLKNTFVEVSHVRSVSHITLNICFFIKENVFMAVDISACWQLE